ncbi:MAG: tetraacyldisaccharide 4'-kinase, partial [Phycisphaerae bacterium]|nr:tetraacyldisaccharide 4'-kinase [Phycisphaerae bacterium]
RGYKAAAGRSDEADMLRIELGRPAGLIPRSARQALAAPVPTDVPVFIQANRRAAAREAVAAGADVLVMDDGFQHLRVRRDLDIVLIDATCPFGFGHVLPRGLLREGPSALKSADAIVITRADAVDAADLAALRQRLAARVPRASLHTAAHRPTRLTDHNGEARPPSDLAGKRVLAFCGVGNPQSFFNTLKSLGAELAATQAFNDHTLYGPRELGELEKLGARTGAKIMITTQKDAVKLPLGWLSRPLWKLAVEMEIIDGRQELLARIQGALKRA